MRPAPLIAAACAAVALGGCGAGDDPPAPAPPQVRLEVTAPQDRATVRRGTVEVRGRVSPATAAVSVLGRPALVSGGSFRVLIPLEEGVNLIDVAASARRRTPAFRALRVTREVLVAVPDLVGVEEDEVAARLDPLDLHGTTQEGGGFFDALRPGPRVVCEQEPFPQARVRRGATVTVVVARSCDG